MNPAIKPTNSPKYIRVTNPTPEMTALAQRLARGNWARIDTNSIVVHTNFRGEFEKLVEKANAEVAPVPTDIFGWERERLERWAEQVAGLNARATDEFVTTVRVTANRIRKAEGQGLELDFSGSLYGRIQNGMTVAELKRHYEG